MQQDLWLSKIRSSSAAELEVQVLGGAGLTAASEVPPAAGSNLKSQCEITELEEAERVTKSFLEAH
eukprot:3751245-Amphidinium_carterae.4